MDVAVNFNLALFLDHLRQVLCSIDNWIHIRRGITPPSVEVAPNQVCPVVPVNDSVNIQHRNYVDDIIFPQGLGLWLIG